ncbi:MAG: V-type ATP synthase subunit A, partial [Chlamydiota bacterium]|nr:V-type ATP synthase subunit A [Chlamydiota bacterium]
MTESVTSSQGEVIKAFGNLIHVKCHVDVSQGEVVLIQLKESSVKGEVIEIQANIAKVQVFERMEGIAFGTPVTFTGHLLEAELGPGLLSSIVDGLQHPLQEIADHAGLFLKRGIYPLALNREKVWDYQPQKEVGDWVERGEVLGMTHEGRFPHPIMLPFSYFGRYRITWIISPGSYTVDEVVAKIEDEKGREHAVTMVQKWPIKRPLIAGRKRGPHAMMETGERIIDTQFPIAKGGTFCTPGPFGAGKTVLQHHLSKYSNVDVVVMAACGERAGEVVEILKTFPELRDPHTGDPLINRTVMICNTSSMPVAAREASVYLGVTIGEYYRQMGLDVLLLADSTSRWAQAMREMSGRLEEIPGEEAFPAYLASRIAAFYERSGVLSLGKGKEGSLTICGAVSPAGGNFEEPVTQATLNVVGAFLGLSRERSDARRYPAIDPLISWSKYVEKVGKDLATEGEDWAARNFRMASLLEYGNEVEKRMEVLGEEGIAIGDFIQYLKADLYDSAYLQQNAFDPEDTYAPFERQLDILPLIWDLIDRELSCGTHDEARSFFLQVKHAIRSLHLLPFKTEAYWEE